MFLHNPVYEDWLCYITGNPIFAWDLKWCAADTSRACVLLTDKNSSSPSTTDHKNILTALAIKKYV